MGQSKGATADTLMDFDDLRYICLEAEDGDIDAQGEDDESGLEFADPAPPAAFTAVMYEAWPASRSRDWRPRAHGLHIDAGPVKMGLIRDAPPPRLATHSRAAPVFARANALLMERVSQECGLLAHLFETGHQTLALDPHCDTTALVSTATRIVCELGDLCGSSARSSSSPVDFHRQLLGAIDTLDLPQVVLERIKRRLTPADASRERAERRADELNACGGSDGRSLRRQRQRSSL